MSYINNIKNRLTESHKKYKYWLSSYYLIYIIIGITIPINFSDWFLVWKYADIRNDLQQVIKINEALVNDTSWMTSNLTLNKLDSLLQSKIDNKIKTVLYFQEYSHPFDFWQEEEGVYFKTRRKFLSNEILYFNPTDVSNIFNYLERDSLLIINQMAKYSTMADSLFIGNSDEDKKIARKLRSEMVNEINYQIDTLFHKYRFGVKRIEKVDFKSIIDSTTIRFAINELKNNQEKVERLFNTVGARIPYSDLGITLPFIFLFSFIFFIIMSLWIPLLRLNYVEMQEEFLQFNRISELPQSLFTILITTKFIKNENSFIKLLFTLFHVLIIVLLPLFTVVLGFYIFYNIITSDLLKMFVIILACLFILVYRQFIKKSRWLKIISPPK